MKFSNRSAAACVLLSYVLFTSCNKKIDEPTAGEINLDPVPSTSDCKPVIYGMYQTNTTEWTTIAQRWYVGDQVKYIKTHFSGRPESLPSIHFTEPLLNIDWGEVSYEGNQVRVWDVAQNRLVFRATLDGSGKPVASYLYNQRQTGGGDTWMFIDTSYYNYTGDQLSSIFQIFERTLNGSHVSNDWEEYTFAYNGAGNLTTYTSRNEEMIGRFNYGAAVNGSFSDYVLTTSFKMLEYLGLTRLPTNSRLSEFKLIRLNATYPHSIYTRRFNNYEVNDGFVQSYQTQFLWGGGQRYYIGWECASPTATSSVNRQNTTVKTLDEFKQIFQTGKK